MEVLVKAALLSALNEFVSGSRSAATTQFIRKYVEQMEEGGRLLRCLEQTCAQEATGAAAEGLSPFIKAAQKILALEPVGEKESAATLSLAKAAPKASQRPAKVAKVAKTTKVTQKLALLAKKGAKAANTSSGKIEAHFSALRSVFDTFGGRESERHCYAPEVFTPLGDFTYAAQAKDGDLGKQYKELLTSIERSLQAVPPQAMSVDELLVLMEDILSYVSASAEEDVSLYVQSKLTAAVADALYLYCCANSVALADALSSAEPFLFVLGDLSGIQDFLYTLPSKGALRSLRGRSFYLELSCENYIDELLIALGLTRASVLYAGGGHFCLLAPNTQSSRNKLSEVTAAFNRYLLTLYGTRLYLAVGATPAQAADLRECGKQRKLYARASEKVREAKVKRYDRATLLDLFSPQSACNVVQEGQRECAVCHTSTQLLTPLAGDVATLACPACNGLYALGRDILDRDVVFALCSAPLENREGLPFFSLTGKAYLYALSEKELASMAKEQVVRRVYSKNKPSSLGAPSRRLFLADYAAQEGGVLTFAALAERSGEGKKGMKRLGVLRADVDNLGAAFLSGFVACEGEDPLRYASFARTCQLSREMSLFFKVAVNQICGGKQQNFSLGGEVKKQRSVHVVYSGGDDVFLVGAWDDLLEVAVDMREAFRRYTQDKLTFSAGLALYRPDFPLSQMAEITGQLLEVAKAQPDKDSLALMGFTTVKQGSEAGVICQHVYTWQEFTQQICAQKLQFLQEHCCFEEEVPGKLHLGRSQLHKFLNLLQGEEEQMSLVRLAYALARLEPKERADQALSLCYNEFTQQLYKWCTNAAERRQLVTALQLIIYSLREEV